MPASVLVGAAAGAVAGVGVAAPAVVAVAAVNASGEVMAAGAVASVGGTATLLSEVGMGHVPQGEKVLGEGELVFG